MRIVKAEIQGYRCISNLTVEFDILTAIVGSGGVGKSTILNALDWFFRGGELEERDLHFVGVGDEQVGEIFVAVTFADLSDRDREVLGAYVEGGTTTLTRTWSEDAGQKLSGNALVFEPFDEIRAAEKVADLRSGYRKLYNERGEELGLPVPINKREDLERSMEVWEREHPDLCVTRTKDARHLGGFTGTPLLQSRFDFVLVSARAAAPEVLGGGRDSVLDRLLSVVEELSQEANAKIADLQAETQAQIQGLVSAARGGDLLRLSKSLTDRTREYFPGAAIRLRDELAPPSTPKVSVRALISDRGGHPIEPDLQGHGLQRALVIALLHELAESRGADEDEADSRSLMLAIEEPELYQHPLQARALAASLERLASNAGRSIQVAYSTHSPFFTSPALFADLRLCRRTEEGGTSCVAADPEAIASAVADSGYDTNAGARVKRALAESLREAIFARAVILCEGSSDEGLLAAIGDIQGGLDRDGVAIAQANDTKSALIIAIAILRQLKIPFLALFDGDNGRELPSEARRNEQILAVCGETAEEWPDRAVRENSANFADTLETDLAEIWPEFASAREEVVTELGVKPASKEYRLYYEAASRAGNPPQFLVDVLDAARSKSQ